MIITDKRFDTLVERAMKVAKDRELPEGSFPTVFVSVLSHLVANEYHNNGVSNLTAMGVRLQQKKVGQKVKQ